MRGFAKLAKMLGSRKIRPPMGIASLDTQVIIVGAGPVGLTLAIDLGRRGVRCILL